MQPTHIEAMLRGAGRESEHPRSARNVAAGARFQSLQGNAAANQSRCDIARGVFRRVFLAVALLASIALASDGDPLRVQSLTKKVFCNCGCREVLAECSHVECNTRGPLQREIASAILQGKTDDRILDDLGMKYGGTILVVPAFRGFDALLWIVPVATALIAVVVFVWRRWPVAPVQNQ